MIAASRVFDLELEDRVELEVVRRDASTMPASTGAAASLERSAGAWHAAAMRQYLVVVLGVLVLAVGLVAKSYLNKQVVAPIDMLVRAGQALTEAMRSVSPDQHPGLEPHFAALATACANLGPSPTSAATRLCERAEALRRAAKAGASTNEGAREVQQAMDTLAAEVAPGR